MFGSSFSLVIFDCFLPRFLPFMAFYNLLASLLQDGTTGQNLVVVFIYSWLTFEVNLI